MRRSELFWPGWRWGLGGALIDSDPIAVTAVLVSLLIDGEAVLVMIYIVRLARNWWRHRQQRIHSAAHLTYPGADCNDTRGQPQTPSAERS